MTTGAKERILKFLKKNPNASQREISESLGMHRSSVTKLVRELYERGFLIIIQKPGMSMRYSLSEDSDVLRSPNGEPLYLLYFPSEPDSLSIPASLDSFVKALVRDILECSPETLKDTQEVYVTVTIPALKRLILLCEILANASPEQFKATLEAYEKKEESR